MWFLVTREQTLVTYENIRVQRQCKNIWTPHVMRSPMVPSFCILELPRPSYHSINTPQVFLWNALFTLRMALYWKFQHAPLCQVFANGVRFKVLLLVKIYTSQNFLPSFTQPLMQLFTRRQQGRGNLGGLSLQWSYLISVYLRGRWFWCLISLSTANTSYTFRPYNEPDYIIVYMASKHK